MNDGYDFDNEPFENEDFREKRTDDRRFKIYLQLNQNPYILVEDLPLNKYLQFKYQDDYVYKYCVDNMASKNEKIEALFRSLDSVDFQRCILPGEAPDPNRPPVGYMRQDHIPETVRLLPNNVDDIQATASLQAPPRAPTPEPNSSLFLMMEDTKSKPNKITLTSITFDIIIDGSEWQKIQPTEKFEKDRITLRLNDPWTDIVCEKIRASKNIGCPFAMRKQHFYKSAGFPYFDFYGYCTDKKCPNKLYAKCENPGSDGVTITIECGDSATIQHDKARPIKGIRRKEEKQNLLYMKPTQYKQRQAHKLLNDSGGMDSALNNTAVYNTMRQEARNEFIGIENYPGDPITAILKMKKDYPEIREISSIGFHIYYWSNNQLKLWKEIFQFNPSVSIDASGSFVKKFKIYKDNKCSDIFFYNIVSFIDNKIYTLCQMLSSNHDTHSIFLWLSYWLDTGAPCPKEVVVDGSSALLNAVALAFNNYKYSDYLSICFRIVNGEKEILPRCLIKRDRAHLLKAISQWKCFKGDNWTKKDFYLRLIAYSLEIEDIELLREVILSIFIVCESEYSDPGSECQRRKSWLLDKIATFNYTELYNIDSKSDSDDDDQTKFARDYRYLNDDFENSEKDDEEFLDLRTFITNIHNQAIQLIAEMNGSFSEVNNYYFPQISKNLTVLFSEIFAWTNVMNMYYKQAHVVATSTRSECYYRIMRREYSLYCALSLQRFLLYHLIEIIGATRLGRRAIKKMIFKFQNNVQYCLESDEENSSSDHATDESSILHKNELEIGFKKNVQFRTKNNMEIDAGNSSEEHLTYSRKKRINRLESSGDDNSSNSSAEMRLKVDKKHSVQKKAHRKSLENVTNVMSNTSPEVKMEMSNERINAKENLNAFYMSLLSKNCMYNIDMDLSIAHYDLQIISKEVFSLRNLKDELVLWWSQFLSLKPKTYIEGNVIDSFMAANCISGNWRKVSYIPTSQTNYICGHSGETEKPDSWIMYNIVFDYTGLVFLPYCISSHWCLLVLDTEKESIMHLDPLGDSAYAKKSIQNFRVFSKKIKCPKNNLHTINWDEEEYTGRQSLQSVRDGDYYNCGVFVMFYMNRLASKQSLYDADFNPDEYRSTIAELLLSNSQDQKNICLYCSKSQNDVEYIITCKNCQRWIHGKCLTLSINRHKQDTILITQKCIICETSDAFREN